MKRRRRNTYKHFGILCGRKVKIIHAPPVPSDSKMTFQGPIANVVMHLGASGCMMTRTPLSWRLSSAKVKTSSKKLGPRRFHARMSDGEVEMADTGRLSGTSTRRRSIPVWNLGFLLRRVQPTPTCRAKKKVEKRR
jgi:hypothetical protein